jgi:hypothetical protein
MSCRWGNTRTAIAQAEFNLLSSLLCVKDHRSALRRELYCITEQFESTCTMRSVERRDDG